MEPYVHFLCGFQRDIALKLRHTMKLKSDFSFFSSSDSFCLIASHNILCYEAIQMNFRGKNVIDSIFIYFLKQYINTKRKDKYKQ